MVLRNGKFYDDAGNVVPLEFGNKEQIALLDRVEMLTRDGAEFWIDFGAASTLEEMTFKITCVCGDEVKFLASIEMDGITKKCSCGLVFVCHEDDDCYVTVKIRKIKK